MNRKHSSILTLILAGILTVCLSACGGNRVEAVDGFTINRYEKVLLESAPSSLQSDLAAFKNDYHGHLINCYPEEPGFLQMAAGFISDPVIQEIYAAVKEQYGDLSWLESDLSSALGRALDLDENARVDMAATLITAQFDYTNRTYVEDGELLISIDQYVLPEMEKYGYFGLPMYLVSLSRKEYILPDCMAALAHSLIRMPDTDEPTLLDRMIMEGKTLYFIQQTLPKLNDTLLFRYTAEQLDWMKDNEANVWSYLLQQKLLYETDYTQYHNLIDEAPKTNAFSNSAPRCAAYIGWRIVDAYMQKHKGSIHDLMENTQSQAILQSSGYRPQK